MPGAVPSLRAFAISRPATSTGPDTWMQETLMRAIANIDSFQPGTNMSAGCSTILRNLFRSEYRKRRREVGIPMAAMRKRSSRSRTGRPVGIQRFSAPHSTSSRPNQREALILVGASGFSYEGSGRRSASACGRHIKKPASTVHAHGLRICWRSRVPRISALIIPHGAIMGGRRSPG